MDEKKLPTFAEMVAQWTGYPAEELEKIVPTEEDARKAQELKKKLDSLSPEERKRILNPFREDN